MSPSFKAGAREGFRVCLPVSVGLVPWALVTGLAMVSAGFTPVQAMGMSFIVFGATAQLGRHITNLVAHRITKQVVNHDGGDRDQRDDDDVLGHALTQLTSAGFDRHGSFLLDSAESCVGCQTSEHSQGLHALRPGFKQRLSGVRYLRACKKFQPLVAICTLTQAERRPPPSFR